MNLDAVSSKYATFGLQLTISDAAGRPLSRYRRIQRVVPPELIQQTTTTTGPFNPEQAKSR